MNASGKTTREAALAAAACAIPPSLSRVPSRSKRAGSTWTQATVTGSRMPESLLPGRRPTEPAASGRLDRDDVSRPEVARDLRGQLLPVQEVSAEGAWPAAVGSLRRSGAALADDREPAGGERAQRPHHAVSPAQAACAARSHADGIALDAERVGELERFHRRIER